MIGSMRLAAISLGAIFAQCFCAGAEELISTVAPSKISISSNFSGGVFVVFGAIKTGGTTPRPYDVVVTVTGPPQTVTARRKERIAGIWINKGSRTFVDAPSFLGAFANRPLDAIASPDTLRQQKIGLRNAVFTGGQVDSGDPFWTNLVDIRIGEKLYQEQENAVAFLSPTAFRVEVPLPQSVLIGNYEVDLKLFSNGAVVAHTYSTLDVVKVGVEAFVVKASVNYSLYYGLATTAMALLAGWLASIAFRRD